MQYLLTGFTQDTGVRVFEYERVAADWVRTVYRVTADLALARKHGIQMQELPLLCRTVLEQCIEGDDRRAFTFTEGDMTLHANLASAEREAKKKKTPRRSFAAGTPESASAMQSA